MTSSSSNSWTDAYTSSLHMLKPYRTTPYYLESNCPAASPPPIFNDFTPENLLKFEAVLNEARITHPTTVHYDKDNQFYIEKLKASNYTYNNHMYMFRQVSKLIYVLFDDIKQEWKIINTERH